jgi:regulator of sirC expression with transglutaminase-like and TPR domain
MTEREKSSSTNNLSLVESYDSTGRQYLANVIELWGKKELRKSSEMLWGAVIQSIKALAASRSITKLYGLSELHEFVRELAKELGDDSLRKDFRELRVLHTNFYDENIFEEDFPDYFLKAIGFIDRIDKLRVVTR